MSQGTLDFDSAIALQDPPELEVLERVAEQEQDEWHAPISPSSAAQSKRLSDGILKVLDHEAHYFSSQVESFTGSLNLIWLALQPFKEDEYMELVGKMRPEAVQAAKKIMQLLMPMYYENIVDDVLGNVYMEIRSRWKGSGLGQFFTPMPLCEMMCRMQMSDVAADIAKAKRTGERIRICDPCVGSGAMLLAAKRIVMQEAGYAGLDSYEFMGQDVDPICVLMCRIQLKLTDYRYMANRLIVAAHDVKEEQRRGQTTVPGVG